MTDIDVLLAGYRQFYHDHFVEDNRLYRSLSTLGQSPQTLVIACSDSRVDPALILNVRPGDIFVVRNVANLIPCYEPDNQSHHGTSAAIEFAVCGIGVKNIIVLGHSQCMGVRALLLEDVKTKAADNYGFSFLDGWINIAHEAKTEVMSLPGYDNFALEDKLHHCEKSSIKISLKNLMTFPWIKDLIQAGKLNIYGWHFCVTSGKIESYDFESETFALIDSNTPLDCNDPKQHTSHKCSIGG